MIRRESERDKALYISSQAPLYVKNLIGEVIKGIRGPGHIFTGPVALTEH